MNRKLSFIGVGLFIFLFLFFSIFSVSLLFHFQNALGDFQWKKSNKYQYLRFNPKSNQIYNGRSSTDILIGNNDYLSYFDRNKGEYVLVSRIENDEYICSGSCFCEAETNRRVSSVQGIGRGLFYLVASVSSYLAYEKSKEYFKRTCHDRFSTVCPSDSITSTTNVCRKKFEWPTKPIWDTEKDMKEEIDKHRTYIRLTPKEIEAEKEAQRVRKYFWCEGNCMYKDYIAPENPFYHDLKIIDFYSVNDVDCQAIECQGQVDLDTTGMPPKDFEECAILDFQQNFLHPYCFLQGRRMVPFGSVGDREVGQIAIYFCSGDKAGEVNPTIECRMLEEDEIQDWPYALDNPEFLEETGLAAAFAGDPKTEDGGFWHDEDDPYQAEDDIDLNTLNERERAYYYRDRKDDSEKS